MHPVLELFDIAKHIVLTLTIASVRLMACLRVSVFFSQQYVTGLGRNTYMVSMTLILFPMFYPDIGNLTKDVLPYFLLVMKEAFLGTLIGVLGNFIFYVAQSVGFLIDTQRGSTMASVMNPLSEEQTSPLGNFLMFFVMAFCMSTGAFFIFLEGLYSSYKIWPITQLLPNFKIVLPSFFLQHFGDDFMVQLMAIAGPVIFILFLAEFGLGMVARFAPQLNVFFLAMPVKSALAIFFLILYFPYLIDYFKDKFLWADKVRLFLNTLVPLVLKNE